MHLLTLHEHGSSNPLGVTGNADRLPMAPYFIFKDLVTIFLFFLVLAIFVLYAPNMLGHSDNYIPANPLVTPPSIEWYISITVLVVLAQHRANIPQVVAGRFKIFRSFSDSVFNKPERPMSEQSGL